MLWRASYMLFNENYVCTLFLMWWWTSINLVTYLFMRAICTKLMMWLWMVHFEHEKLGSSNKFKKMKSLCNRRVSVWNPNTSKEIVHFVHEVHLVFVVTFSTFSHMLCGWNDDTMPTFNLFRVHLKCFLNFRVI